MKLDIVTANLHVVSKRQDEAVKGIAKRVKATFGRYPDVIGCQEAIQLQGFDRVGRYRVVKTTRPHVHDNTNAILIKRWFPVKSSEWHFGAHAFGDGLNHNPRHFHVLKFSKRGRKVAVIDAHLSVIAEPHGRVAHIDHLSSPLVRTHAQMAVAIANKADALRDEGYVVTVTADSNDNTGWQYALRTVLSQRGYRIVLNDIDLIAVHPSQAKPRLARRPLVIPRTVTLSDHEALAAAFAMESKS